ncbi:MAG: DUF1844 domain-containing protein [Candidatus Sumerlaeota bacterium]|nr:DUF1844 domain-containing protein [Candidatus Sumerlaeota bacterium]
MVEPVDKRSGAGRKEEPQTPDAPKPEAAASQPQAAPGPEAAAGARPEREAFERGPLPPPDFIELIQMLFLQAMVSLGEGRGPEGPPEVDFDLARHYIGMLELLETKTKGHLTEVESKYLEGCLHQSRLAFVAKMKTARA